MEYNVIVVINHSTVELPPMADIVAGLQAQVKNDLAMYWPVAAEGISVVWSAGDDRPRPNELALYLLDTADQAGALGYHTDSGKPLGKVFIKTTVNAGYNPTVTISHELLEMIVDPECVESRQGYKSATRYALEVCDPVEADRYAYSVGEPGHEIMVSDFVTPDWFTAVNNVSKMTHPFDFKRFLAKPRSVGLGGYFMRKQKNQGWTQIFGSRYDMNGVGVRPGTSGRSLRRHLTAAIA